MPGPEESRTPYPLLAKQTLYQMSYRPEFAQRPTRNAQRKAVSFMRCALPVARYLVGPDGLEPSTPALSTLCSSQLS